jgi:hypothetical protein
MGNPDRNARCPGRIAGNPSRIVRYPGRMMGNPDRITRYPGRKEGFPGRITGFPGRNRPILSGKRACRIDFGKNRAENRPICGIMSLTSI